jgi:ribosomal protein S18 acetylase RimI-like enzyme
VSGLRPATLDDVAGIERLQRSLGGHVDDWNAILETDPDAVLLVAAHPEAGVVGYALARLDDGGTEFDGEVTAIAVLEPYRRQGIGGSLAAAAVRQLWEAGAGSVRLWAPAGGLAAAWFVRAGGRVFGEREVVRDGTRVAEVGLGWADLRNLA